jgi:hypothetical protein
MPKKKILNHSLLMDDEHEKRRREKEGSDDSKIFDIHSHTFNFKITEMNINSINLDFEIARTQKKNEKNKNFATQHVLLAPCSHAKIALAHVN